MDSKYKTIDDFSNELEKYENKEIYLDKDWNISENPHKGINILVKNKHFRGKFYYHKGVLRPYEEDYDKLKNYKGLVYVNEEGKRSLTHHWGLNYVYDNGKFVTMITYDPDPKKIDIQKWCVSR